MKIIKLLGIFILTVAGVFTAINIDNLFGSSHDEEFADKDELDITDECDKIRQQWSAVSQWDREIYQSLRSDIDQSKSMGLFSREGYNTVNNTLRETSVNKACDAYKAELKSSEFKDVKLQKHYSGVREIMAAESMEKDERIKDVIAIHDLYMKIRRFANSRCAIGAKFDGEKAEWVSFSSRQNGMISTARSYRNNAKYSEVKGIPGFAEALNEDNVRRLTEAQRSSFYSSLSNQIVSYYNAVEATQTVSDELNSVYDRFANENEDKQNLNAIATCLTEMENKLKTNE